MKQTFKQFLINEATDKSAQENAIIDTFVKSNTATRDAAYDKAEAALKELYKGSDGGDLELAINALDTYYGDKEPPWEEDEEVYESADVPTFGKATATRSSISYGELEGKKFIEEVDRERASSDDEIRITYYVLKPYKEMVTGPKTILRKKGDTFTMDVDYS